MLRWTDILIPVAVLLALAACNSQPVRETATSEVPTSGTNNEAEARPDTANVLSRATAALRGGSAQEARDLLVPLTQAAPDNPIAWLNLGIAQLQLDQPEDAVAALERSTELAPQSAPAHNLLGVAYRRVGQVRAARDAYTTALRLDPDYALAHYNLAVLYDVYLQQPDDALSHYRRYETLTPNGDTEVGAWISQLESHHVN